MNHTKEPWYVVQNKKWRNADYRISNKENDEWVNFGQIAYASESNAKRIAACVNACADVEDDCLEQGYVKWLQQRTVELELSVMNLEEEIARLRVGDWEDV